MDNFPRVSLALPLYKSRRFVDILIENLDSLDWPNLEILISDRHGADDALDCLQARYGHDARFRFFRAWDELDWVAHYNFLLRAATGTYFLWMPHDDSYASNYVSELVTLLETNPDAILAFSRADWLFQDGNILRLPRTTPFSNDAPWAWTSPLQLFLGHHLWLTVRGIFRRAFVIEHDLFMPATRENNAADLVWAFAMACSGRFVWTRETFCRKRFYPQSTHAQFKQRTWRHTRVEYAALRAHFQKRAGISARLRGEWMALLWLLLRFAGNLRDAVKLHKTIDARVRRFLLEMNLW